MKIQIREDVKRRFKWTIICFIAGFLITFIFTKHLNFSLVSGVILVFIYLLIDLGEIQRLLEWMDRKDLENREERKAYERRHAELKTMRENSREREIGRREAGGEYARREANKIARYKNKINAENRRREFRRNPFGIKAKKFKLPGS